MHYLLKKLIGTGMVCGMLVFAAPLTSMAAIGPGFAAGTYVATVTAESVNINKSRDSEEVLLTAKAGSTYEVLEDCGDGWMKVRVNDTEGYLPVSENAVVEEAEEGEIAKLQKEALESSNTYKRQQLVNYALQFVGGPYKYGGSDPRTGVDCSGFTRYVYQNGAGISLNRSSTGQSFQGKQVSADQMQPGDLLFYGSKSNINHVAMYIGDGKIVHASTERTGITISNWDKGSARSADPADERRGQPRRRRDPASKDKDAICRQRQALCFRMVKKGYREKGQDRGAILAFLEGEYK